MTFFGSFNHHERERKTIVILTYPFTLSSLFLSLWLHKSTTYAAIGPTATRGCHVSK